jgi:hypothetical protein
VAGVELADQLQQAGAGGVEMRGDLGDLVPEAIEPGERLVTGADIRLGASAGLGGDTKCGVHRRVLPCSAPTLHRDFRDSVVPPGWTIAARSRISRPARAVARLGVNARRWSGIRR